jgi:hypothetical protein
LTPLTQHWFSTRGLTSLFSQHIALVLPPIATVPGYENDQARQRASRSQRAAQTAGSPEGTTKRA